MFDGSSFAECGNPGSFGCGPAFSHLPPKTFPPIFAQSDENLNTAPFDATAHGYDQEFTETQVGRMQRAVTHRFLTDHIQTHRPKSVLELNCGTGEDALWLARRELLVTATDLSAEMVQVTTEKVRGQGVRVLQAGIQDIRKALPHEKYDLIWSNFGGFNCLTPLEIPQAASSLHTMLKPKGFFVAVVMGNFCAWETLYFGAKCKLGTAFRRLRRGPVAARLAPDRYQDTYYYSVGRFERLLKSHFIPQRRLAVGAYLPPSFLDPFFAKRPQLLAKMERWETKAYLQRFPAMYSDHYLVAFQKK